MEIEYFNQQSFYWIMEECNFGSNFKKQITIELLQFLIVVIYYLFSFLILKLSII